MPPFERENVARSSARSPARRVHGAYWELRRMTAHACGEFARVVRAGDDVVGARVKPGAALARVVLSRDHNEGDGGAIGAQAAQ